MAVSLIDARFLSSVFSGLLLSASTALTAGEHDHSNHNHHRHHDAHVHGHAELTLAVSAEKVEMQLTSPAANLVGFEHQASTDAQKQTVKRVKQSLETAQSLFVFSGSDCRLKEVEVDMAGVMPKAHEHKHHDGHHHDHHKDTSKAKAKHSEITASYQFECQKGKTLNSISLTFLKTFTGIEKLDAQWITPSKQGAAELTAANNVIRLQ